MARRSGALSDPGVNGLSRVRSEAASPSGGSGGSGPDSSSSSGSGSVSDAWVGSLLGWEGGLSGS